MVKELFQDVKLKQIDYTSDTTPKNIQYETKLFNSEFYQMKFVYDSFSFLVKFENFTALHRYEYYVSEFEFYVSSTLSSKMLIKFTSLDFDNCKTDDQNYTDVMYISRNNELPLYNSAYANYIRSGYNFDIKTKNRQMTSSIVQSAIGIAGGIAGAGLSATGFGAVAGASLITTSLARLSGIAFTTAQHEQDIQQKLKQAEMQGMSVAGSDDIDLLERYANGNKKKLVKYEVSPRMKKILWDLFYYTGYIANYQGVPNTTTRKHFNFVQAKIVFENTPNLPQDICDEISAKYEEGITFFHKFGNAGTQYDWDLAQQYENWETTIVSANTETLNIE